MKYVSAGSTASLPITSICLHANCAVSGLLSQYTDVENSGGQFVGKCVSGRCQNSKTLVSSPSCLDFSADNRSTKDVSEDRLHNYSQDLFSEQAKHNLSFFFKCTRCWLQ